MPNVQTNKALPEDAQPAKSTSQSDSKDLRITFVHPSHPLLSRTDILQKPRRLALETSSTLLRRLPYAEEPVEQDGTEDVEADVNPHQPEITTSVRV